MTIAKNSLPVSIEDLLSHRKIESDRIEFKEGWNPDSIYRSICAFANDFDNIGGGYIIIGVEEQNGMAVRPVKGLSMIHRELERNGSPPPIIETDDDRTFFRVILTMHPAFEGDEVYQPASQTTGSLLFDRLRSVLASSDQAGDLAGDLADDLADDLAEMVEVIKLCAVSPRKQNDLFKALNKKPHADTRSRYLDPLEKAGLIEKTIPDKPTSPKQQYRLTDKGRQLLVIDSNTKGAL